MNSLHIDIVSDIACPWCAIGFARLQQALADVGDSLTISYTWRAFELDPGAVSEPILPALARKYGRPEEEMRASQAQMIEVASELGLNFEKMQQRHTANTFDAHRLVKWAGSPEQSTALYQALFDAYFGHARDVSDREVLLGCVEQAGLDRTEAAKVLDGHDHADQVRQEELRYQGAGVNSVPSYIVNERYIISGAQDSETLVKAFRDISEEAA